MIHPTSCPDFDSMTVKGSWLSCSDCGQCSHTLVVSDNTRIFLCAQCFELRTGSPLYVVRHVIHRPKKQIIHTCTVCGNEYPPFHKTQLFCSKGCRTIATERKKENKTSSQRHAFSRVIASL